jgi:non-ribosomal peptide synthetase component F
MLMLTLHHIISDGWSMQVLVAELTTLYSAFSEGRPSPLPELPVQYADYAAWQREVMSGELLEAQLSYWRTQLAELQTLNLPLDRPRRGAAGQGRSASEGWTPPEELSARLDALAGVEGATTYMVLLAAFQLLLGWYSGQDDVAVGTDIANRHRAETEGLIGFFVNQLVLRTDLSGDPTFSELVGRVRRVALDAYAHQELPFDKLTEALNPDRGSGLTPLFQVKLVMQNAPAASPEVEGLALSSSAGSLGRAKFDLLLNLAGTGQGVVGALEYNAEVFDAKTVRQLLEDYTAVLDAALDDPRQRLSTIHAVLVAAAERRRRLEEAELEALRARGLRRLGRRAPMTP